MQELKYTYREPKDKPIVSISVPDGYGDDTLEVHLEAIATWAVVPCGRLEKEPNDETIVVIQDGPDSVAIKLTHAKLLIKALEDIVARGVPK